MNLAGDYLMQRGLQLETATGNGVEIDLAPQRERIVERLGKGCVPLWNLAQAIVWFRVRNLAGATLSWIARPLPTLNGGPKFVTAAGGTGPPFITKTAYKSIGETKLPLIITEGPVKALVLAQAGFAAVGLNGVWCAHEATPGAKLVLRFELVELGLRGRKVCLALDADAASKPDVRHASIRLFFLLSVAGAEVFQLTSWDENQAKGIDDYLVAEIRDDPQRRPADIIKMLLADAQLFIGSFSKSKVDLDAVESELKKVHLSTLYRDQICKNLHEPLGVKVDLLRAVGQSQELEAKTILGFAEVEPWPDPVNADDLLHNISAVVRRHVVLDEDSLLAVTFWILLSYLTEVVDILPFLAVLSPVKRCGKTRLLTVLQRLVYKPMPSVLISAPALYRSIEKWHPTMLFDEAENFLQDNHELRALLNSSHQRDQAWVPRCVGDNHDVQNFSTWSPKVIAQIGKLHTTLEDRSIVIMMRRRTKNEIVEPLRATAREEFKTIQRKITRWVADNAQKVAVTKPKMPLTLNDRAADNWSPLFAIAEVAGEDWGQSTLKAAVNLSGSDEDEDSLIIALLFSLRAFCQKRKVTEEDHLLPTLDILAALNADKEAPWADWREGAGLSAEKLSNLLKPFGVKRVRKRIETSKEGTEAPKIRGYKFGQLQPLFERYLSSDENPTKC
jgi:Protein of unknown function (DUF3631)/Domain of unknown function (DUF3854)